KRYHAPMARTVLLGKPNQLKIDTMNKTIEALNSGISAIKAGNTVDDVAQAFWKILDKYGIEKRSRTGYSIGIGYPPDWGERTASIRAEDTTVLEAGMVFHFMPALWLDTWGLETTETILIREDGAAEALCNVERKLFVKN
ncbi:MAG: M24 family metallopeptidase, partial [Rhodobacteraceae bacterium]|nr:M24 family metallopeptidase [Paracoccaceae bacterium]